MREWRIKIKTWWHNSSNSSKPLPTSPLSLPNLLTSFRHSKIKHRPLKQHPKLLSPLLLDNMPSTRSLTTLPSPEQPFMRLDPRPSQPSLTWSPSLLLFHHQAEAQCKRGKMGSGSAPNYAVWRKWGKQKTTYPVWPNCHRDPWECMCILAVRRRQGKLTLNSEQQADAKVYHEHTYQASLPPSHAVPEGIHHWRWHRPCPFPL